MSTTTIDTSLIDEKKNPESSKPATSGSIYGFVINVFIILAFFVLYLWFGSCLLYSCKLAQSNILPTDKDCYPYTDTKAKIEKIMSNIFNTFTDPPQSMKINFDADDKVNSTFMILDAMRKWKSSSKFGVTPNYFMDIFDSLLSFNYSYFNSIFNLLNSAPELVTVLLGPIVIGFCSSILFLINNFYFIYLWFMKMSWFFKENKNKNANGNSDGKPDWENITFLEPINYGLAILMVILYLIIFVFGFGFLTVIPTFTAFWSLFSCFFYKANMNNKSVFASTIAKDVFKYFKVTIMLIFSIIITLHAFTYLGVTQGVFSLLVILLINFGVISINIFKPINQENLSPLTSYDQAIKDCVKKSQNKGYSFFGQNGGGFVKELKKISKKLNSK
jgi:hypothetical protein